jgi:hypothetical protein
MLLSDELTRRHAAWHLHTHAHRRQAVEALRMRHGIGEVAVFGVGACFLEGAEAVFAFVVFFLAAVAVGTIGAIAAVVRAAMSVFLG